MGKGEKKFKQKNVIIQNVDCMEYMRSLEDKSFDLGIVDPPNSKADKIIRLGAAQLR